MIVRFQVHNSLFPACRHANVFTLAASLAPAVSSSNFAYFYAIQVLHGVPYLRLVGSFADLEGVRALCAGKMGALLRNQRPNYYAGIIHVANCCSWCVWFLFKTDKNASFVINNILW